MMPATNTSRRCLLGAIAAAPVALAVTTAASATSVTDPKWPALVADYRAKYAAWMTAEDVADEAEGADRAPTEALRANAYAAYEDAFNAMADHPASSAPMLAEKMDLIFDDYKTCQIPEEYLAILLADARRIAGEVQS